MLKDTNDKIIRGGDGIFNIEGDGIFEPNMIGDVSIYLRKIVTKWLNHELPQKDFENLLEDWIGNDFISVDGDDYFKTNGVLNFYSLGFSEELIENVTSLIKYLINELGLKMSPIIKRENSGLFRGDVIRFTVELEKRLNESIDTPRMPNKVLINKFLEFCTDFLDITHPYRVFLTKNKEGITTTAYYDVLNKVIVIYIRDRSIVDIMRSIAHELVHHKQNQDGRLTDIINDGSDGSPIENEANAEAGKIIRIFGKQNPEIYNNNK